MYMRFGRWVRKIGYFSSRGTTVLIVLLVCSLALAWDYQIYTPITKPVITSPTANAVLLVDKSNTATCSTSTDNNRKRATPESPWQEFTENVTYTWTGSQYITFPTGNVGPSVNYVCVAAGTNTLMVTADDVPVHQDSNDSPVNSDSVTVFSIKVSLAIEVEDPKINGVRSGLDLSTLQIKLNGTSVAGSTSITYETIDDEQVPVKLNISYTPTLSQLIVPGTNTVTVDIDDRVSNHMDRVINTFQLP